jgi:hypothetical protein
VVKSLFSKPFLTQHPTMYPPNRSTGVGTINHRHSGPTAATSTAEDTLEKQNDGMMSHLQSKITNLKNVSSRKATWFDR